MTVSRGTSTIALIGVNAWLEDAPPAKASRPNIPIALYQSTKAEEIVISRIRADTGDECSGGTMGKSIIMHIDEAPWLRGKPRRPNGPIETGNQLIGDLHKGPWIHINSVPPNEVNTPHSHNEDEVIVIMEGSLTLTRTGDRTCGPGTVMYIEKETDYGFTAGPEGVRFLIIHQGLAKTTRDGVAEDTWTDVTG